MPAVPVEKEKVAEDWEFTASFSCTVSSRPVWTGGAVSKPTKPNIYELGIETMKEY